MSSDLSSLPLLPKAGSSLEEIPPYCGTCHSYTTISLATSLAAAGISTVAILSCISQCSDIAKTIVIAAGILGIGCATGAFLGGCDPDVPKQVRMQNCILDTSKLQSIQRVLSVGTFLVHGGLFCGFALWQRLGIGDGALPPISN